MATSDFQVVDGLTRSAVSAVGVCISGRCREMVPHPRAGAASEGGAPALARTGRSR